MINEKLNLIITMKRKTFIVWCIFSYLFGVTVVLISEHYF